MESNLKERKTRRERGNGKKILGTCLLVLSILIFILCLVPNFLSIGKFFQGIFGVLIYPLCLLFALVAIALIMGLSYTFDKKFTAYLIVASVCLLCLLHTIFTSSLLYDDMTSFSDMGSYLRACYNMSSGITVGGLMLGILVFLIRGIIGLGGAYVFFAIFATVFIGLIIDYAIYSRGKNKKKQALKRSQATSEELERRLNSSDDENLYSFQTSKPSGSFSEEYSQDISESQVPLFQTTDTKTNDLLESDENISFSFNQNNSEASSKLDNENSGREKAKSVLFGDLNKSKEDTNNSLAEESSEPKSAREILFGSKPNVPNIFDRDSEERDAWRRQYASKPLVYHDENEQDLQSVTGNLNNNQKQEDSKPFEKTYEENDDGSLKTSWGTYKPTSSFNSSSTIENSQPNFARDRREFSRNSSNITNISQTQKEEFNSNRPERNEDSTFGVNRRVEDQRLANRTSVSNFNKFSSGEEEGTEFSSRLTSRDRRASGDILANASSLGIEMKEQNSVNNFSQVLDNSKHDINVSQNSQRQETKPKVEKMSFENQLNRKYNPPPTSLLNVIKEEHEDYSEEYRKRSAILESTLANFKIPAKVINVVRGPKVTRYELTMPTGVPVSRVLSYDKDMSMNLATKSGVRIEAPIPGKNAFGVEVENTKASMVGLRELVESAEFRNFKAPLPVAIGKNISGEIIIKSLSKMVHVLVAGSTGSGKSVFLHSLIMSLMYRHSPDELRFIMIDPKRVEFSRYNRMPHMMLPEIVTECSKAVNALAWAVKEMERRYQLLVDNDCQKIEQFNECQAVKEGREKRLPYLVIVIDELAELMSVAAKDVEGKIQRITQLGRASGIHMVIATQRPSVNIVTGTIKNNLPTRIAFSLASAVDSGTIINQGGAEKLLGQGDMLLSAQDSNQLVRLQAAFVSDEEIKKTLNYIKEHNVSVYDEDIQKSIYAEPEKEEKDHDDDGPSSGEDRMDEYMPQALKLVMKNGKASISMIQRRFSVGYARAARIIDQMETRGFIDGGIGNKPRDVKITVEEYNELFGDYDSD